MIKRLDNLENELMDPITIESKGNPWKTIVVYVIVGILWILFSDRVLSVFVKDQELYIRFQSYKGAFYVVVTAIMLFFLIKLDYKRIITLTETITAKNKELIQFSKELLAVENERNQKIVDLNAAMADLNAEQQFVDEIYNNSNTAIMIWNLDGEVIEVNQYFYDNLGYSEADIVGERWNELIIPPEEQARTARLLDELKIKQRVKNFENKVVTKDGRVLEMIWNDAIIFNPQINESVVVSFGIDITVEKENERKAFELAFKDRLTGFDNRVVFEKEISRQIDLNHTFTLYYVVIDNFRNINDTHGHQYGDLFLKDFSVILKDNLHDCQLYRWCGDEFMILEEDVSNAVIEKRIGQLYEISKEKWTHAHIEYHPSLSIGIARFPEDGRNRDDIFKNIDTALHHAKAKGKSNVSQYHPSFQKEIERRLTIENAIHEAVTNDGFELVFQPIYALETNTIRAAEILLRWRPGTHTIDTGEFIAIAEETGQIIGIDRWVLRHAFRFIEQHLVNVDIVTTINLSSKTIVSSETIAFLNACLTEFKIDPTMVELEMTEHSLIEDLQTSYEMIDALKALGFRIALDDFGTRYSSLNYLGNIPFDTLKIDKSYIDKIISQSNDLIIVEQIIQLTKRLGINTIAEGIETKDQLDTLTKLGCDYGQGYYLSRPVANTALLKLIQCETKSDVMR